jgi:hypothetical protein
LGEAKQTTVNVIDVKDERRIGENFTTKKS